jgi:hypothetical protein
MLSKQLITLASILAILGCGACFLPSPIDRTPPPPPPLHIDLRGVRTIGVTLTNESETHRLGPAQMAKCIVDEANYDYRETKVRVRVHRDGGNEDAELKLVILKEGAVRLPNPRPGVTQKWAVRVSVSGTLTARDGRVIWQETNRELDAGTAIMATDEAEFLQKLSVPWVNSELCYSLVMQVFYGDSK